MSLETLSQVLQLTGLVLDIVGVVLMANGYLRIVPDGQAIRLIVSAFLARDRAREVLRHLSLTSESKLSVVQGLALVGLGFLLQASGVLVAVIAR